MDVSGIAAQAIGQAQHLAGAVGQREVGQQPRHQPQLATAARVSSQRAVRADAARARATRGIHRLGVVAAAREPPRCLVEVAEPATGGTEHRVVELALVVGERSIALAVELERERIVQAAPQCLGREPEPCETAVHVLAGVFE